MNEVHEGSKALFTSVTYFLKRRDEWGDGVFDLRLCSFSVFPFEITAFFRFWYLWPFLAFKELWRRFSSSNLKITNPYEVLVSSHAGPSNNLTFCSVYRPPHYVVARGGGGGVLTIMAYTGKLRPKEIPLLGFRYIKG